MGGSLSKALSGHEHDDGALSLPQESGSRTRSSSGAISIHPFRTAGLSKRPLSQRAKARVQDPYSDAAQKRQLTDWLNTFSKTKSAADSPDAYVTQGIFILIMSGYFGHYPIVIHRISELMFKAMLSYCTFDLKSRHLLPLDMYMKVVALIRLPDIMDDVDDTDEAEEEGEDDELKEARRQAMGRYDDLLFEFVFRVYAQDSTFISVKQIRMILELVYHTIFARVEPSLAEILKAIGLVPVEFSSQQQQPLKQGRRSDATRMTMREFQDAFRGIADKRKNIITRWIFDVLEVLSEPVPSQFKSMQALYSAANNLPTMISLKYSEFNSLASDAAPAINFEPDLRIDVKTLQLYFKSVSLRSKIVLGLQQEGGGITSSPKDTISLHSWLEVTEKYMNTCLSKYIFFAFCKKYYAAWFLSDFVEFCFIFGKLPLDARLHFLCDLIHIMSDRKLSRNLDGAPCAAPSNSAPSTSAPSSSSTSGEYESGQVRHFERFCTSARCLVGLLTMPALTASDVSKDEADSLPTSPVLDDVKKQFTFHSAPHDFITIFMEKIQETSASSSLMVLFDSLLASSSNKVKEKDKSYDIEGLKVKIVAFLSENEHELQGLHDLSILANCVFGVKPSVPILEDVLISELLARHSREYQVTQPNGFGVGGTIWGVVPRKWWISWTDFIGDAYERQKDMEMEGSDIAEGVLSLRAKDNAKKDVKNNRGIGNKAVVSHPRPGQIDSTAILTNGSSANVIRSSASITVLPPLANHALLNWYGGGPFLLRTAVSERVASASPLSPASPSTVATETLAMKSDNVQPPQNGEISRQEQEEERQEEEIEEEKEEEKECEENEKDEGGKDFNGRTTIDLSLLKLRFSFEDTRRVGGEKDSLFVCMNYKVWREHTGIVGTASSFDTSDVFGYFPPSVKISDLISTFVTHWNQGNSGSEADAITIADVTLFAYPVITRYDDKAARSRSMAKIMGLFSVPTEERDITLGLTPVRSFQSAAHLPAFYVDKALGGELQKGDHIILKEALPAAESHRVRGRSRRQDGYFIVFTINDKRSSSRSSSGVGVQLQGSIDYGALTTSASLSPNPMKKTSLSTLMDLSKSPNLNSIVKIRSNSFSSYQVQSSTRLNFNNGTKGMDNLGNSCYINSPVQAVLHLPHLRAYFLSNSYFADINVRNPMGYQGQLADSFAKLAFDAWLQRADDESRSIAPRHFRDKVGELNAQFEGRLQQDAQEFFNFLIDGLSEDLNLIDAKKCIEYPDSNGRSDQDLSKQWWEADLARDTSIVQALFAGQFRSEMVCSDCLHQSVRFDKFNLVSLGLPENNFKTISVHVMPKGRCQPLLITVEVDRRGVVADLVWAVLTAPHVAGFLGLNSAEVTSHKQRFENLKESSRSVDGDNHVEGGDNNNDKNSNNNCSSSNSNDDDDDSNFLNQFICCMSKEKRITKLTDLNKQKLQDLITDLENSAVSATLTEPASVFVYQLTTRTDLPAMHLPAPAVAQRHNYGKRPGNVGNVRVIFSQRRQTIPSAEFMASAKFAETCNLQNVAFPFIDTMSNCLSGEELYDYVYNKLRFAYRENTEKIATYCEDQFALCHSSSSDIPQRAVAAGLLQGPLTDDVVNGRVPRRGFTLRVVCGGSSIYEDKVSLHNYNNCVRCVWLRQCRGCVIPDSKDNIVSFRDCETVAIDFHNVVIEEFLDLTALCTPIKKSSNAAKGVSGNGISLYQCLGDFTKEESMADTTCSKCKLDNTVKKSMSLYRLPPILVIQLKRFQSIPIVNANQDIYIDIRKLYTKVDFPLEGFDARPFLAKSLNPNPSSSPSSPSSSPRDQPPSSPPTSSSAGGLPGSGLRVDECLYDLYSAVHHIGSFNGGHYVSVVNMSRSADSSHRHEFEDEDKRWWIFNDEKVEPISPEKVTAASAYLLFYVRRDIQNISFEEIFKPFRDKILQDLNEPSTPNSSGGGRSRQNSGSSSNSKQHNFKPFDVEGFQSSQKKAGGLRGRLSEGFHLPPLPDMPALPEWPSTADLCDLCRPSCMSISELMLVYSLSSESGGSSNNNNDNNNSSSDNTNSSSSNNNDNNNNNNKKKMKVTVTTSE